MWFCDWTKVEYNCSRDWLYDIGPGLLFDTEIEGHLLPLNNKINCPVEWGLIVLLSVATTWAKKKKGKIQLQTTLAIIFMSLVRTLILFLALLNHFLNSLL